MESDETDDHQHQHSSSSARFSAFRYGGGGGGGGDGGVVLYHPAYPVLGLGLALGMSFLTTALLPVGPPPKPLSVAIKLANEALRGTKALHHLHSPGYSSLLFASETLVKGYKFSTSLNLVHPSNNPLSSVVNTMKPCLGAISVFRYVRSPVQDLGFLGFGLLSYGYKFSKNFFKVLKGVGGFEMDVALKNGFDSLGLVVKVLRVAKELGQIGGHVDCPRSSCLCEYSGDDFRKALVGDVGCGGLDCVTTYPSSSPRDRSSSSSCRRRQVASGEVVGFVEEEGIAGVWVPQPPVLCLALPLAMDGFC